MDRQLIYPAQVPLETDLLNTNRNILSALGLLTQDVLGTTTLVAGLACTPNSPAALNVVIAPGRIYALQSLDATAYSSLAADTTHQIVKQGILLDAITLACAAPVTAGMSINYLIEATYQDADTTPVTLLYYNASNPAQAYSGPNNSGAAQSTQRKGTVVLQAKAGIAATTGTQVTPTADAGYVGLFVVTVANGQATITSGNIAQVVGAPFIGAALTARAAVADLSNPANGFGADMVHGGWRVVDNMAALLALSKTGVGRAFVLGYTTPGDGGGGPFFLKASSGTALPSPVNAAFSTATTGGTLAAGTYYYCVTAINNVGETLGSTETSIVTTGATSTVTVNWGAVAGATAYRVYGRTTGAEQLLMEVDNLVGGPVTTWVDTGAITPYGTMPASNTTLNNGGSQSVASDGGIWALSYTSWLSVMQFGAKLDYTGTAGTDDTIAFRNCALVAQQSSAPAFYNSNSPRNGSCTMYQPAGQAKLTDSILVTRKMHIEGEGQSELSSGSRINMTVANKHTFYVAPIAQGMSFSIEKITLSSNIGGTGNLVNVIRTTAACNSQRYVAVTWATPQLLDANIECGDDIQFINNLWDGASGSAISLGSNKSALHVVSNAQITGGDFFHIPTSCILAYNLNGLTIGGGLKVSHEVGFRTQRFIDALNTTPTMVKNITIGNASLDSVDCLIQAQAISGLNVTGTNNSNAGLGASATMSYFELYGACDTICLGSNNITGNFGTHNVYNDTGATVTKAAIVGNQFAATGGTAQALSCAGTQGTIQANGFTGFATPSVSEQFYTTGNAISPGTIAAASHFIYSLTLNGARQGDKVTLTPSSLVWPTPDGIVEKAYVSVAGTTIAIKEINGTAAGIAVPAHDFGIMVTR